MTHYWALNTVISITTLMVSRLMLNLRQRGDPMDEQRVLWTMPESICTEPSNKPWRGHGNGCHAKDLIPMTVIGNLGEPVGTFGRQTNSDSDSTSGYDHTVC